MMCTKTSTAAGNTSLEMHIILIVIVISIYANGADY